MENLASSAGRRDRLTRAHLIVIAVCAIGYLMDGFSAAILGPFAPAVARSLQLSKAELGPMFSANLLGQCVGLVIIPLFQGRLGPRRTIVLSTILFGLAALASGLAANRDQLLACRLIIGVGVGGALPAAISLVAELVPASRRATAIMTLILAFTLGPALAGLVGGLFAGSGDNAWRWALSSTGALSLLAAAAQGRWLPDSPSFLGGLRANAASPKPLAKEDAPRRLFSPGLLWGTLLLWSMYINATIVIYCLTSWLPTLLVDTGRSARLGGMALTAYSLGGVISTLVVGPLIERIGTLRTLGGSFVACALLLAASAMSLQGASDALLLALLGAVGFFLFGAYGGINVLLADFYPAALRSVGAGWAKSAGRIGSVVAPIMVGLALTWGVQERNVLFAFIVPALLVVLAIAGMKFASRRAVVEGATTSKA